MSGTGRLSPDPGGAQPEIVAGPSRAPPPPPAATAENPRAEAKDQSDSRAGGGAGPVEREGRGRFSDPNSLEKRWQS